MATDASREMILFSVIPYLHVSTVWPLKACRTATLAIRLANDSTEHRTSKSRNVDTAGLKVRRFRLRGVGCFSETFEAFEVAFSLGNDLFARSFSPLLIGGRGMSCLDECYAVPGIAQLNADEVQLKTGKAREQVAYIP